MMDSEDLETKLLNCITFNLPGITLESAGDILEVIMNGIDFNMFKDESVEDYIASKIAFEKVWNPDATICFEGTKYLNPRSEEIEKIYIVMDYI